MNNFAERLAQGDPAAWTRLYEGDRDKVVALCLGYLYHREDALDAAEEAFVKALNHKDKLRANGNVRAWLLRIAANTCKDWLRKRERGRRWLKRWLAGRREAFFDSPVERAVACEARRQAIREAIAHLDETFRVPLVLRYYADMDYEAIAALLSELEGRPVPTSTVASRLHRAKAKIERHLEGTP